MRLDPDDSAEVIMSRLHLGVAERDPVAGPRLGEVGQRDAECAALASGSPRARAGRFVVPTARGSPRRQCSTRSSDGRPSPVAADEPLRASLAHLFERLQRRALVRESELLDEWASAPCFAATAG